MHRQPPPDEPAHAPLPTLTADGRAVPVHPGQTLHAAMRDAGVDVPGLCDDVRLDRPHGTCGLCVVEVEDVDGPPRRLQACRTPARPGMVVRTSTPAIEAYRTARLETLLCDHDGDCVAPCVAACPGAVDVQTYLRLVAEGNHEAALRVIRDRNPFPSVCGRVCPHPCEDACRRSLVDEPVAINAVKRFAADWDRAREQPWLPAVAPPSGRTVAVVGSGPSGLAAAYYLAIAGHAVTVYEKQDRPGGMLRYGIPDYRLPTDALDHDVDVVRALGVEIRTGRTLGADLRLADLRRDHDAVYLAIGSWRPTPLRVEGEDLPGVLRGIEYLEDVTDGVRVALGATVVVGGGNTAVDCARTALRGGATRVTLVYRRGRDEMPAEPHEVADALAEGVELVLLTAPTRIAAADGRLQVHCVRMALGEPDASGRRRPVPVEGTEHALVADTVIAAVGQSTDASVLAGGLAGDVPVTTDRWGDVRVDGGTLETAVPGVLAGGDCVTGPATVIQAVAAGRRAASAIDQLVRTGRITPEATDYACSRGSLEDLDRHEWDDEPRIPRVVMPTVPVPERLGGFVEVETGLTEEQARAEASRCLECGCSSRDACPLRREATSAGVVWLPPLHVRPRVPVQREHAFIVRDPNKCIACGLCVAACAEIEGVGVLDLRMRDGRLVVGTLDDLPLGSTDCVSCGQCVRACPCGALDFTRATGDVFRAMNDPSRVVVGFVAPAVRTVVAARYGVAPADASAFVAGLLRRVGFDRVFDFAFAADLTVLEETTELLGRVTGGGVMPLFTSCCPGWVSLVERRWPGMIPHLSSCRSPQQMMGATVRQHYARRAGLDPASLHVVSIVPCLAKKDEAARPGLARDGRPDVDSVLTTTELLEMADTLRLEAADVVPGAFDPPYQQVSGAGVLFGASGGVAEAALRLAVERLTGDLPGRLDFHEVRGLEGFKEATVVAGDATLRVAVISGLGNVDGLVRRIVAGEDVGYDLVEVMACPGGCINGAGQPLPERSAELPARQGVLVEIDRCSEHRRSQENPDLLRLYDEFYGEPGSPLAHELLHTSYAPVRP